MNIPIAGSAFTLSTDSGEAQQRLVYPAIFDEMRGSISCIWGGPMTPRFYESFSKQKHTPLPNDIGAVVGYVGTEEDVTAAKN